MAIITHKKNNHRATPWHLRLHWKPRKLTFEATFKALSKYYLPGEDQYDWNKLTGLAFTLNPRRDSIMVAWRYNEEIDLFQFAAYYHYNKQTIISEILCEAKAGEKIEGEIYLSKSNQAATVSIKNKVTGDEDVSLNILTFGETKKPLIARQIQPWFGGNRAAPHYVAFELQVYCS